jgi:hypothetical protein
MSAESWRSQRNLLGADSLNSVDRWRAEMDALERERAKERQEYEREESDRARAQAPDWSAIDARIAAALAEQREEIMETIKLVLSGNDEMVRALEGLDRKYDRLEGLLTKLGALYERVRGLYEVERVRAHEPEAKRFHGFARERGDSEVLDLPDFIRKMN